MTEITKMTKKQMLWVFIKAFVLVSPMILLVSALVISVAPKPTAEQKFEVVDSYQGCAVVRYTDETQRWHYFLDCSKGQ